MAVRRLSTPIALVAAVAWASGLRAVEFEPWATSSDWYLSVGVVPLPEIEEDTSGPGGSSTYEWKTLDGDIAPRVAVGYLTCSGGPRGGWALGIEGVITTCDVTPSRYEVDGLTFSNTSNNTLRYSTLGAMVYGGYQFGINEDADSLSSFLLVAPFVGLGASLADSEVRDQGGTYDSGDGVGWYLEGGLRVGFFLTEKKWVAGVVADLLYQSGETDVDFGNSAESTLTHERFGLAGSLVVGYRL